MVFIILKERHRVLIWEGLGSVNRTLEKKISHQRNLTLGRNGPSLVNLPSSDINWKELRDTGLQRKTELDLQIATAGDCQSSIPLTIGSLLKKDLSGKHAWLPQELMTVLFIKHHKIEDTSYCNGTITLCNTERNFLNTTKESLRWYFLIVYISY